jgi:hypothetical protein
MSGRVQLVSGPFNDTDDRRIHRTNNIGHPITEIVDLPGRLLFHAFHPDARLEMKWAAWVIPANPAGHGIVALTVAGFIPERPEDDRRMILVPFDHAHRPLQKRGAIPAVAPDLLIVGVRLQVCLIDQIQPECITKVEPVRVVRVMRGADRVEVEALHYHRIEPQGFAIQRFPF